MESLMTRSLVMGRRDKQLGTLPWPHSCQTVIESIGIVEISPSQKDEGQPTMQISYSVPGANGMVKFWWRDVIQRAGGWISTRLTYWKLSPAAMTYGTV